MDSFPSRECVIEHTPAGAIVQIYPGRNCFVLAIVLWLALVATILFSIYCYEVVTGTNLASRGMGTADFGARLFFGLLLSAAFLGTWSHFVWRLAGREILILENERLALGWKVFGIGRKRHFTREDVERCHVSKVKNGWVVYIYRKYRAKPKAIGLGVDKATAERIASEIKKAGFVTGS